MPSADEAAALDLAARLRRTLATQDIRVSMGVSEAAGTSADELREEADTAQYEAKRSGRDRVTTFPELDVEQVFTPAHAKALEAMIEHRSLSVAFQPIWSLGGEEPLGYEALARPTTASRLPAPRRRSGSPSDSGSCTSSTSSASRPPWPPSSSSRPTPSSSST